MKIVPNVDYTNPKDYHFVKCPKYNQDATITIFYRATKICKTDIQPTLVECGRECDLRKENK